MPRMNDSDLVLGIVQGIVEPVVLHTGQPEKGVNVVADERVDDGLPAA